MRDRMKLRRHPFKKDNIIDFIEKLKVICRDGAGSEISKHGTKEDLFLL